MSDWNKDVLLAEDEMLMAKQNAIIEELREENEVLRKTLVRVSNEKARIIDKQNIDYLSFASQLRHEICEKIKKFVFDKNNNILVLDNTIDLDCLWEILDQIEKGEE